MRILFWNIWGHRDPEGIHRYIAASGADICCFTEVTDAPRTTKLSAKVHTSRSLLEPPSHINGLRMLEEAFGSRYTIRYARPPSNPATCLATGSTYDETYFGSALLVSPNLSVVADEVIAFGEGYLTRMFQGIVIEIDGERHLVCHLHGVWIKDNPKGDHPLRNEQSKQILREIERITSVYRAKHIVFGGDLNLDLNTHAIRLLEAGTGRIGPLRNLIREFEIIGTRTASYRKLGQRGESRYADYIFVSNNVTVDSLVIDTSVTSSDHAPLLLEYR